MEEGSSRWRVVAAYCGAYVDTHLESPTEKAYRAVEELAENRVMGIQVGQKVSGGDFRGLVRFEGR